MAADKEQMVCVVCDQPLSCRWTDRHGVGACMTCNVAYRLIHYEGGNGHQVKVDRPPQCLLLEEWVPILRAYWEEHRQLIPNGCCFPGSSYDPTCQEDYQTWGRYLDRLDQEGKLPGRPECEDQGVPDA